MKINCFLNEDGGAGKTTFTASIAERLALDGYKILLLDLTPKCSLSRLFDTLGQPVSNTLLNALSNRLKPDTLKINENIDIWIGDNRLVDITDTRQAFLLLEILDEVKDNYDYILIDTFNNGVLVDIALMVSDRAFIVCKTSKDSVLGAIKLIDKIESLQNYTQSNFDKKSAKLEQILLNQVGENSVSYKVIGELTNNPLLSPYYDNSLDIPFCQSVNRLNYGNRTIGGNLFHTRASKGFKAICEKYFNFVIRITEPTTQGNVTDSNNIEYVSDIANRVTDSNDIVDEGFEVLE